MDDRTYTVMCTLVMSSTLDTPSFGKLACTNKLARSVCLGVPPMLLARCVVCEDNMRMPCAHAARIGEDVFIETMRAYGAPALRRYHKVVSVHDDHVTTAPDSCLHIVVARRFGRALEWLVREFPDVNANAELPCEMKIFDDYDRNVGHPSLDGERELLLGQIQRFRTLFMKDRFFTDYDSGDHPTAMHFAAALDDCDALLF